MGDLRVQVFFFCVCVCASVCARVCAWVVLMFFFLSMETIRLIVMRCAVVCSQIFIIIISSSFFPSFFPFSLSLFHFFSFAWTKKISFPPVSLFFVYPGYIHRVSVNAISIEQYTLHEFEILYFFCVNNERTQNWLFEIVCILDPLQPPQKVLGFLLQLMNLAKVIKWKYLVDASDWTRMQKSVGLETWKSSGTHKNEEKMLKWRRNDVTTTHNRNRLKQYHEIKDVGVDNQQFIGGQWRHLAAFKRTLRSRCKSTENFGFYKTVPRKSRLPKKSP